MKPRESDTVQYPIQIKLNRDSPMKPHATWGDGTQRIDMTTVVGPLAGLTEITVHNGKWIEFKADREHRLNKRASVPYIAWINAGMPMPPFLCREGEPFSPVEWYSYQQADLVSACTFVGGISCIAYRDNAGRVQLLIEHDGERWDTGQGDHVPFTPVEAFKRRPNWIAEWKAGLRHYGAPEPTPEPAKADANGKPAESPGCSPLAFQSGTVYFSSRPENYEGCVTFSEPHNGTSPYYGTSNHPDPQGRKGYNGGPYLGTNTSIHSMPTSDAEVASLKQEIEQIKAAYDAARTAECSKLEKRIAEQAETILTLDRECDERMATITRLRAARDQQAVTIVEQAARLQELASVRDGLVSECVGYAKTIEGLHVEQGRLNGIVSSQASTALDLTGKLELAKTRIAEMSVSAVGLVQDRNATADKYAGALARIDELIDEQERFKVRAEAVTKERDELIRQAAVRIESIPIDPFKAADEFGRILDRVMGKPSITKPQ